jgi:hypothetical protein
MSGPGCSLPVGGKKAFKECLFCTEDLARSNRDDIENGDIMGTFCTTRIEWKSNGLGMAWKPTIMGIE